MAKEDKNHAVMRQLMALGGLSVEELKDKWRDLYGSEQLELKHSFLVKRLAYRIQELYYGGLDTAVKARIEMLSVPENKQKQAVSTTPGTRLPVRPMAESSSKLEHRPPATSVISSNY